MDGWMDQYTDSWRDGDPSHYHHDSIVTKTFHLLFDQLSNPSSKSILMFTLLQVCCAKYNKCYSNNAVMCFVICVL